MPQRQNTRRFLCSNISIVTVSLSHPYRLWFMFLSLVETLFFWSSQKENLSVSVGPELSCYADKDQKRALFTLISESLHWLLVSFVFDRKVLFLFWNLFLSLWEPSGLQIFHFLLMWFTSVEKPAWELHSLTSLITKSRLTVVVHFNWVLFYSTLYGFMCLLTDLPCIRLSLFSKNLYSL